MLSFDASWVFFALPLPLLVYWLAPRAERREAALWVPFFAHLAQPGTAPAALAGRRYRRPILLALCWAGLCLAASGPNWIGEPITLPDEGRELMLAVDLSESMLREDMLIGGEQSARIIAVKAVLNDFIEQRRGDRIGLILFADQAYVQAPLTYDLDTVRQLLREAQIGFAGSATAIGDAIGLGVKRLRERAAERHVLILLTDGANTAGEVSPLAAARLAAENGITIYCIGVGADEMISPGLFGSSFGARRINPSADLDEQTLQQIASQTGGQYFRARNPEQLQQIYALLDQLEPIADKARSYRPRKALFYWPLAIACLCSLLLAIGQLPLNARRGAH